MIKSTNGVYETALNIFGLKDQMIKCIEELSELQKELCKLSLGQGSLENATEEMADVEIMLEQMKIGLNIGFYEFTKMKSEKLHRLNKKLRRIMNKEKLLPNEVKCQKCLYTAMTQEEIKDLGSDPCGTCHNFCNWKAKEV